MLLCLYLRRLMLSQHQEWKSKISILKSNFAIAIMQCRATTKIDYNK